MKHRDDVATVSRTVSPRATGYVDSLRFDFYADHRGSTVTLFNDIRGVYETRRELCARALKELAYTEKRW